jgi:polyisoprenoid-binding protein YceI
MTARYRFDPEHSRFTVQGFAGGVLSFMAHSPTFAVRGFAGKAWFDPAPPQGPGLEVTVQADSLDLADNVRPADREEIMGRMRQEVLETAAFPAIRFEAGEASAAPAGENRYQIRLHGRLALHGVTAPHEVDAQLLVYYDGIRLSGESALRLSDYRIRPVTALGGAIKLKDQLAVTFDLVAWKDGQRPEGL